MVSNIGSLERVNTSNTFLDEKPHNPKRQDSLGGVLVKYTLLLGLNKLTFGKLTCVRNAIDRASETLLSIGLQRLKSGLQSSMGDAIFRTLAELPMKVQSKLQGLQCQPNPEGLIDRGLNFIKDKSGVNQAAQLANEMTKTAVDLLILSNGDNTAKPLDRLLFIGGILYHNNTDVKQVLDEIKSVALDKIFSKEFITAYLKDSGLGKFSKMVNFIVGRFGVQNMVDKFLTDYLFANPKFDMTRMELRDTHEILIAEGMQRFIKLDGPNWNRKKIDDMFSDLVKSNPDAQKFAQRFESIEKSAEKSKLLVIQPTRLVSFILSDILKPLALNATSNIAQMSPEEFYEIYKHPERIENTMIAGLVLGENLDMARQIDQGLQTINQGFSEGIQVVNKGIQKTKEKVNEVVEKGKAFIGEKLQAAQDLGHAAVGKLADGAQSLGNAAVAGAQALGTGVTAAASVAKEVASSAANVAQSVVNSATEQAVAMGEKVKTIAQEGVTAVKNAVLVGDIDISDAFDGLDEELGWGDDIAPQAAISASAESIPPGVVPEELSEVTQPLTPLSAEAMKAMLRPWDRPHIMELQNTINGINVQDANPIEDKGWSWTATYVLPENVKSAIFNDQLTLQLGDDPVLLDADDRVKSMVTQLHAYIVDQSSRDDATQIVTQCAKLWDSENLKLFLPEDLRSHVTTPPQISVVVQGNHPLTFETRATWQVDGHEIGVQFLADIKETRNNGWTGATLTGTFASTSVTDPEKDSLRHIRYSFDREPWRA